MKQSIKGYVTTYTLGTYVYNGITSEDKRQRPITKASASGEIILAYHPKLALLDSLYIFLFSYCMGPLAIVKNRECVNVFGIVATAGLYEEMRI